jgi:hypothetical protein
MKTSPAASTATFDGRFSLLPTVVSGPPAAGTSTTLPLPRSAMKTSPTASTASPSGKLSPLPERTASGEAQRGHAHRRREADMSPGHRAVVGRHRLPTGLVYAMFVSRLWASRHSLGRLSGGDVDLTRSHCGSADLGVTAVAGVPGGAVAEPESGPVTRLHRPHRSN